MHVIVYNKDQYSEFFILRSILKIILLLKESINKSTNTSVHYK